MTESGRTTGICLPVRRERGVARLNSDVFSWMLSSLRKLTPNLRYKQAAESSVNRTITQM